MIINEVGYLLGIPDQLSNTIPFTQGWKYLFQRIYRRYIDEYFYMNIDISEIYKNTLKFMEILSKSVKMTLIIKYIH